MTLTIALSPVLKVLGYGPPKISEEPLRRVRSFEKDITGVIAISLSASGICAHDHIFDSEVNSCCPKCGTESWTKLARVMQ
jgi:hypothetical protein